MRPVRVLLCALFVTSCASSSLGPTSPLDTEFTLAPGETMRISDGVLSVRFLRVSGDSRCPADAICIQGGSAAVHIHAAGDGSSGDYQLQTGDTRPVRHEAFTIALVQLSPYPFSGRTIAPEEYRATFKVTR